MTGLYKSTPERDLFTANEIIRLMPKTVRIYPVSVLNGTKLHSLYSDGKYKLISFNEMVSLCSKMLVMFKNAEIDVIRCGLHASNDVRDNMVAGFYHPAFKELCENKIYRDEIERLINGKNEKSFEFSVNDRCISKALGQKRENVKYFEKDGIKIRFVLDKNIPIYKLKLIDTLTKGERP